MRIAVSGTHCTGKTTLVAELHRTIPAHVTIAEPYCLLAEEGHEFAAMPGLHDFELQLERAIEVIAESEDNSIFDRRTPASEAVWTKNCVTSFSAASWVSTWTSWRWRGRQANA